MRHHSQKQIQTTRFLQTFICIPNLLQVSSRQFILIRELVPDKPVFPDEEVKVLKFWEEINAFHKQLELSEGKKEYTFYDGPPFATGLPHYGHIAAGTIKVSL